jgi:hypothetical protein
VRGFAELADCDTLASSLQLCSVYSMRFLLTTLWRTGPFPVQHDILSTNACPTDTTEAYDACMNLMDGIFQDGVHSVVQHYGKVAQQLGKEFLDTLDPTSVQVRVCAGDDALARICFKPLLQ